MRIILLGPPGAGKGTQADFICEQYDIPLLSSGNILRAEIAAGTRLGKSVKKIIDGGHLIPDKKIVAIMKSRIKEKDCKNGFIFDGFPRTIPQARALKKSGIHIDYVIEIVIDDEEIIKRLTGRRTHPASGRTYHLLYNPPKEAGKDDVTGEPLIQREDDNERTVRERITVYHQRTEALEDYYHQLQKEESRAPKFIKVDGRGSVEEVRDRIFAAL